MANVIKKNDVNKALKALSRGLENPGNILAVGNVARSIIVNRTTIERLNANRQAFKPYSTRRYYAPIESRPPGYPAPKGGRREALRGKRRLKTAVYEGGYGEYKAAQGLGAAPQLSVTNRMLSDIQVSVIGKRRAVLFFGDRLSAAKAYGHQTSGRPFFGLHPSEYGNLTETLKKQIEQIKGMSR